MNFTEDSGEDGTPKMNYWIYWPLTTAKMALNHFSCTDSQLIRVLFLQS